MGALNVAKRLRGTGPLLQVAREIAWRRAAFRWNLTYAHYPAELNKVTDALSRLEAVPPAPFPSCLEGVAQAEAPRLEDLWRAWLSK